MPPDLSKLTIAELRDTYPTIPKKFRKREDILKYIQETNSTTSSTSPEPKQQRTLESMFTTSVADNLNFEKCSMCDNETFVWCELGRAYCPLCQAGATENLLPDISVKRERGSIQWYAEDPSSGSSCIRFNIKEIVDKEALSMLVTQRGFGIIESISALIESNNDTMKSIRSLLDSTRESANNYAFVQAQLNSEETFVQQQMEKKLDISTTRREISDDVSLFTIVDAQFSQTYLFPSSNSNGLLLNWVIADPKNARLLYDYLLLKSDAVKWYKEGARRFFEQHESSSLPHEALYQSFERWITHMIETVKNAMYSIPDSGGAVPLVFRVPTTDCIEMHVDDEIQFIKEKRSAHDSICAFVTLE